MTRMKLRTDSLKREITLESIDGKKGWWRLSTSNTFPEEFEAAGLHEAIDLALNKALSLTADPTKARKSSGNGAGLAEWRERQRALSAAATDSRATQPVGSAATQTEQATTKSEKKEKK